MASKNTQQRHTRKAVTAYALGRSEYEGRCMPNITLREKLLREGVPLAYIKAHERFVLKKKALATAQAMNKGEEK